MFDLVKGLGKARRIDEAFQMLESIENGAAAGNPKLSSSLIYGLLDALISAGKILKLYKLLVLDQTAGNRDMFIM